MYNSWLISKEQYIHRNIIQWGKGDKMRTKKNPIFHSFIGSKIINKIYKQYYVGG